MSTRHLVDPELLPGLDIFPSFDPVNAGPEALAKMRADVAALFADATLPDGLEVEIEERHISGPDGNDLPLLIHRPKSSGGLAPVILHIHSGGYVFGSARMSILPNAILAAELGGTVVSVDYRLAPETRFPGAIEDCYTALGWVNRNAGDIGVDPSRLAVMGESAGGGLAASLALLARDRREYDIAHQQLLYPMLDDRPLTRPACAGEFVWTSDGNRFGWQALLGDAAGGPDVSPYAAAARAEDLSGLPNSFILVGALDLFVEENLDYARRLIAAGVPTELHVYPGAYHAFDMIPGAAVSDRARRDATDALRRALKGTA